MGTDERLTEIEIRAAHLENTVHELSEVMYRQQKEIDSLKALLTRLQERVTSDPGLVEAGRQDKPPHY